jgi:hypothetical protein
LGLDFTAAGIEWVKRMVPVGDGMKKIIADTCFNSERIVQIGRNHFEALLWPLNPTVPGTAQHDWRHLPQSFLGSTLALDPTVQYCTTVGIEWVVRMVPFGDESQTPACYLLH